MSPSFLRLVIIDCGYGFRVKKHAFDVVSQGWYTFSLQIEGFILLWRWRAFIVLAWSCYQRDQSDAV